MSVLKIMKTFGPNSGFATSLVEIVGDKKWRFAWVVINPGKHSWYIIERYYWKLNKKAIPSDEKRETLLVKECSLSLSLRGRGNPSVSNFLVERTHYGCGSKGNL